MEEHAVTRARRELQRAESALRDVPADIGAQVAASLQTARAALDELRETQANLAAQQAILDDRLLRVETNRLFSAWNSVVRSGRNISRRVRQVLGSQSTEEPKPSGADYTKWIVHEQACLPSFDDARGLSAAWTRQPGISVIVAVRDGRALASTLASIEGQAYRRWEVCLSIDETCAPQVLPLARDFEAKGRQIRSTVANGTDTASALNAAAALATGEYLSFAEEGSTLSPFALHYIAEALQSGTPDVLYSDEDALDPQGNRADPRFKPDWSPDLLTSCMYMGHLLTVRRDRFEGAGGLRKEYDGAHFHDLALRLADAPLRVHHISRVLYHSAGSAVNPGATARAITDAITRREEITAECVPGPGRATFLVRRRVACGDTTAIVCSRSVKLVENCLASVRATAGKAVTRIVVVAHEESGPDRDLQNTIRRAGATAVSFSGVFNFAAMNNLGAQFAESRNILFLNDDVEATASGWFELLNEQLARKEVGVAGAVLRYPSGALQHAGIAGGIGDGVGHIGRHANSSALWPWLLVTRNVSAVTGACLAIRKELFHQLDGFDTGFPNNYNDVDLCFRVRERGLAVVCVPAPGLVHRECQSRRGIVRFEERFAFYRRWGALLAQPDPYYSPSLTPTEEIALNVNGDDWYRPFLGGLNSRNV